MPQWLAKVLSQIERLVAAGKVRFTFKAIRELAALELGLDEADACDILRRLQSEDSRGRLVSETTGEWMYVFMPHVAETQALHEGHHQDRLRSRVPSRAGGR